MTGAEPKVVVLGSSFAGLTTAWFIREHAGDAVDLVVVDRNPYLTFVPSVQMEVLAGRDPLESMLLDTPKIHAKDGNTFLNADVVSLDPVARRIDIVPSGRPGSAPESLGYDYLVIALGNRLAYDQIEGFGEHGDTVSSGYCGNKLRRRLAGYKGDPIAIGSARFHQGLQNKPDWHPVGLAACEGPPLELGLAMAHWLGEHHLGDAHRITLFAPAEMIAEDACHAPYAMKLAFKEKRCTSAPAGGPRRSACRPPICSWTTSPTSRTKLQASRRTWKGSADERSRSRRLRAQSGRTA